MDSRPLTMEQHHDYNELKHLLVAGNRTLFNLTDALDIIRQFKHNVSSINDREAVVLASLYIPTFLISLFGNALTLYIILRRAELRKVKNIYLANLSFANLAVTLFGMPPQVGMTFYRLWIFGSVLCKIWWFVQGVALAASVFSLCVMSLERYLITKRPQLGNRMKTTKCAVRLLLLIWGVSFLIMSPYLYVRTERIVNLPGLYAKFCIEEWPNNMFRIGYGVGLLLVLYALPGIMAFYCYVVIGRSLHNASKRQRTPGQRVVTRRVARLLIGLVISFIVCWQPYNIISFNLDLFPGVSDSKLLPFALWLGHTHCAIDPIVLFSLHRNLRWHMKKTARCMGCCADYGEAPYSSTRKVVVKANRGNPRK